ncbi:MAG: class IV aminotransferase [Acidobacteria bacterium]|nr:class IV aminotransferase [Acidobacteriota bacterium]
MHRFLLHNQSIRETTELCLSPGQTGFLNGWGVFSTLRVSQGVLFEWDRHWARMMRDAVKMHVPMPDAEAELHESLLRLVAANGVTDATLRVAIVRNHGGMFEAPGQTRKFDIIAFTTGIRNWGESVRLALKADARYGASEFRGAKITSWAQNLTWLEEAQGRGFDEVVLLDEHGRVSECTSANLFASFGNEVVTPPLDSGCLAGITRQVLLEEIQAPGVSITERHLAPGDLERAGEVFITSTTRDLLPVREIEGLTLSPRLGVVPALAGAFRAYLSKYVESKILAHKPY